MEALKPFAEFTKAFSSDLASLGLISPLIQAIKEKMITLRDPSAGYADIVPAVSELVQRLQEGIKSHLEPLTRQKVYALVLAAMCDVCIKGSLAEQTNQLIHWRNEFSVCGEFACGTFQEGHNASSRGGGKHLCHSPTLPSGEGSPMATHGGN